MQVHERTIGSAKMHSRAISWRALLAAALAACASGLLHAQPASKVSYPSRAIRLIVPFAAGGPNDIAARILSVGLYEKLGQPVVVTNVPGAGGRIGSKAATKAEADGYTLMMGGTNLNVVIPASHRNLDYDPVGDLIPVAAIASDEMLVAINPSLPVRTVKEFVDHSRKNPGKINAGAAPGIGPHFAIEMFGLRSGAVSSFVPYKGAAPAITDLVAGHIQWTITNKAVLLPFIQKGQLRALAVTSDTRMEELPDTPTLKESGVLGVPSTNWYGLFAPKGTPAPIVAQLRQAVKDIAQTERTRNAVEKAGLDLYTGSTEFSELLSKQRMEWAGIVKETGITLD
jgi:tripartite-type tricarboxylate transporter receptor subunit TctC